MARDPDMTSTSPRRARTGVWRGLMADAARLNASAADFSGVHFGLVRRIGTLLTPSLMCCALYRISHWLYEHGLVDAGRAVARLNYLLHKAALSPASSIGPGFYIPHPVGVTFQGHAGRDLTLFGRVAVAPIAPRDWNGAVGDDCPTLGDDVTLGASSLVLGRVIVETGARLGAWARIVEPPRGVAAGARDAHGEARESGATLALSIVIVSWKVRDLLRDCLRSVGAQARMAPDAYEVIVVDNDSGDGTVEMLREEFPAVRVIANGENAGFARANNQALPACRGRVVLLLNPDTVVEDHALDRMAEYLEAYPEVGAVGCRLLNGDGTLQRWTAGAFPTLGRVASHFLFLQRLLPAGLRGPSLFLERDEPGDLDVDWVSGACLALRRSALAGRLFDEAYFMYGEDMELCDRLKRAGHRVRYLPAATVVHFQGRSMLQQSGDTLLSGLRGPRAYYAQRNGSSRLWLYDLITAIGYLLRVVGFTVLSILRPGRGYAARVRSSRQWLARALRVMAGG